MPEQAVPAELAQVHQDTAQAFASAYAAATEGGAPAPAAEPIPPREPVAVEPAAPAPAAPTQAAPQPTEPSAPQQPAAAATPGETASMDASSWTPEAKRFLEMEGWDGTSPVTPDMVQRVATRALEFNNRLGARAGATDPNAEPKPGTAPPAPAAPPADAARQVEAQITQAQDEDPECSQMVAEFTTLDSQLKEIGDEHTGQLGKAIADYDFAKRALELPDIKDNPLRTDDIKREMQGLSYEVSRLRSERSLARNDIDRLERRYHDRATRIDSHIRGNIQRTAAINGRAKELVQQWPTLVQKVADDAKIPKESQAEFFEDVKESFVLTQRAGVEIPSLEAFVAKFAERRAKQFGNYYTAKQAEYGALATKRTETVTPAAANVPGPAGATPARAAGPQSLEELYSNTQTELYKNGLGGRR